MVGQIFVEADVQFNDPATIEVRAVLTLELTPGFRIRLEEWDE
jgi:hypothetical protein